MSKKVAVVVTTIFEPRFVPGYIENFRLHGHLDDVELIVIPDRKTPPTVADACAEARRHGAKVLCPTLDEQEAFLRRFSSLDGKIPYDSDNRRNVGFLMALDGGADVLITIDDDNFCLPDSDFVGEHAVAGELVEAPVLESTDGWFNIGTLLKGEPQIPIYPRGFPYFARHAARSIIRGATEKRRVGMNVGLWTGDPDVDAVSRLALGPRVHSVEKGSHLLGQKTWTPINTQNTALMREAIEAYYYVRMGSSVGGFAIDRYGDIFSGYLCQKCVRSHGDAVRVGPPVADHRRTPHNLFKDLAQELAGMVILEELLPWLMELKLDEADYRATYRNLADEMARQADNFRGFLWDQGAGDFLVQTAKNMHAWSEAVAEIG